MKKVIFGIVCMIALLLLQSNISSALFSAKKTFATELDGVEALEMASAPKVENGDTKKANFTSKASILIECNSGEVLEDKNMDTKLPIASMVKIMTALCVMEEIDSGRLSMDEKIAISQTASGMGGSQMFLDANAEYSVDDLLKGVIVVSANDACVALAERVSGSVDGFVAKMNEKANALGMANTHFINCTGLPGEGQYSTARDVATMSRVMMINPIFSRYSKIFLENYTHPSGRVTEFTNTNKLVRFYKDCDGGKTGFTNEAMFCLSAKASKNGLSVISVVIGSSASKDRFAETVHQFNKAFGEYENKTVINVGDKADKNIKIKNGKKKVASVEYAGTLQYFTKKIEPKKAEIVVDVTEQAKAPMQKGDIVGKATLIVEGKKVSECNIVCSETVEKATLKDKFDELFGKMKK